jgi:hypothetical protein
MKTKLIGIIICMLLVGTVLPVTGTLIIDKTTTCNVSGNTLYVGGTGPNNYTKIQNVKETSYTITKEIVTNIGKNWTWMFYDDADFYRAYDPLEDFAKEAYSGPNLDIIVLQDKEHGPAKMWYIDENHNKELLQEMGEINMGDYETLRDFIDYCKNNFSSEHYLLSVYDHGGGWTGACMDGTDKGWLTMNDMQKALTDTGGVDIICFTAPCLMGALESVYELRECVDVYVGSEELSGYGHWYGTIEGICNILNNNPDLSIIEIGEHIIQLIKNNTPWPESITMSAIRTDKMEELANSFDIIAQDYINNFNESFGNVWRGYEGVQTFGLSKCIDAYDFAEKCFKVETNQTICKHLENAMNLISEAVIAECHGKKYPKAHGLTIYFPDMAKGNSYDSTYGNPDYKLDFSINTFWNDFLFEYFYIVEPGIDKEQTEDNTGFVLCNKYTWAQSFIPSNDRLIKINLKLSRLGFILSDIVVSIRSSLDGVDLTSALVNYADIPKETITWIEFDFEDIDVTPGNTYFIICSTNGGIIEIGNIYNLRGSDNANSYSEGDAWIQWPTGEWEKWNPPNDFCFKTYYKDNPLKSPSLSGSTSGIVGIEYEYTLLISYPNSEDVYYYVDWGDSTSTYWIGPYQSGSEVTVKHIWNKQGIYAIRTRARNISGVVSNWATLKVTMPRNRATYNSLFLWFLEHFPILQKILLLLQR